MAGPWEDFATPNQDQQGPWSEFAKQGITVKPKADETGDFARGLKQYLPQTQQMYGAGKAIIGKAIGSDSLVQSGLDSIKEGNGKLDDIGSKPTDEFSGVHSAGDFADWAQHGLGQVAGNVMEAGATALAGAGLGSLAGNPITVAAGGATGLVGRNIVKGALKNEAEKIAAQYGAREAEKFVAKNIGKEVGKNAAIGAGAVFHGVGETGSRAIDEAGYDINNVDLGKVIPAAAAHTAAEFLGNKILLGGLTGHGAYKAGGTGVSSLAKNVAGNAALVAGKEIPVETFQTGAERYAGGLPLTNDDARKEYLDTAAQTALFGVAGVPSGIRSHMQNIAEGKTQAKPGNASPVAEEQSPVTDGLTYQPGLIPGVDVGEPRQATIPANDMLVVDFHKYPVYGPTAPVSRADGMQGIDFTPEPKLQETGPMSSAVNVGVDSGATSLRPQGSFSDMSEFASLLGQEQQDVQSRRTGIAGRQALQREVALQDADQRVADQMAKEAAQRRRAVLDQVLSDPTTQNPADRFAAELQRQGFRDSTPTADELATVQRFNDIKAAQPAGPEIEPSLPNEVDAEQLGIRSRKGSSGAQSSGRDKVAEVRQLVVDGWKISNKTLVSPTGKKRILNTAEHAAAKEATRERNLAAMERYRQSKGKGTPAAQSTTNVVSEETNAPEPAQMAAQAPQANDAQAESQPSAAPQAEGIEQPEPAEAAPTIAQSDVEDYGKRVVRRNKRAETNDAPVVEVKENRGPSQISKRDDLVGAIMRVTGGNGVAASMSQTITGDTANRASKVRGLFTNNGTMDLDDIANDLRTQEGYDVRDGNHLAELIREQAAGNPVYSMERNERDAAANKEKKQKDAVLKQANELGLKGVGGKRTLAVVEAEIAKEEARLNQLEKEAERKAIQAADAIDSAIGADMTEADFMRWLSDDIANTYTQEEIKRAEQDQADRADAKAQASAIADAEERAQSNSRQGNGDQPAAPQGGRVEEGARSNEGFDLAKQTNQQAAEQFAQQNAPESDQVSKEQADRERDAVPFSMQQESQPKPQGRQTGLFTADGRVSSEAKQSKQDDKGAANFSFAGRSAATADQFALSNAERRIEAGDDADEVRKETGWFKGADGKWRFEIDDSDAKPTDKWGSLLDKSSKYARQYGYSLSQVLDHPALFAAYPELKSFRVYADSSIGSGTKGTLSIEDGRIRINNSMAGSDLLSTLLHEIQHGIQSIEGFANGGSQEQFGQQSLAEEAAHGLGWRKIVEQEARSRGVSIVSSDELSAVSDDLATQYIDQDLGEFVPRMDLRDEFMREDYRIGKKQRKDAEDLIALYGLDKAVSSKSPRELYLALAGEVEARNVQSRQSMTAEQRRERSPASTQDVIDSDVIVIFNGKVMQDAPMPANASRGQGSGMAFRDLQAVVDRVSKGFNNLPKIHVLDSPRDLSDRRDNERTLKEQIEQAGAMDDVEGAHHNGEIYLFASGIASEERAEHVLATHEITHYGLRGTMGKGLDSALQNIWLYNKEVRAKAAVLRMQLGLTSNVSAVEEVLAEMKDSDLVKLKGWRKMVQAFRDWAHKAGFDRIAAKLDGLIAKGMSDQEKADLFVANMVNAARDWVRNGKPARGYDPGTSMLGDANFSAKNDTINVDGVDRPTTNSNGKPIAQTDEALRNFWRWFGDSKVVDADGRPRVVYHGTTANIEAFDLSRSGEFGERFADAAFFTSNPEIAAGYAQRLDSEHNRLMSIEDELRSAYGKAVLKQFAETKTTSGKLTEEIKRQYDAAVVARQSRRKALFTNKLPTSGANIVPVYLRANNPVETDALGGFFFKTHKQAFAKAEQESADSVIVSNVIDRSNEFADGTGDVFAVFSPSQIKSAIGNNGNFDASNPDIRFSRNKSASVDASITEIFDGLAGRGLKKVRAEERLAEHPQAESIRYVQDNILDILEELEGAGTIKINC